MQSKNLVLKRKSNLGRRGSDFVFTERDGKILHFLWKWKLSSTATIHEVIGRPLTPYSTYKALERLERCKFIRSDASVEHNFTSWVLTDKGFSTIRNSLNDLTEEGFLSENHWHDRNVLAFQLGEWATTPLPIVTHFTEQEMRRRPLENYPEWVPNIKEHRADGFTRIQTEGGIEVLAYEVELWPKALARYESVIRYYDLFKKVRRVYWLVGDKSVFHQILRAKECVRDGSMNYHVFIDLDEYIKSGWDAPMKNERSENLGTIRSDLRGLCGDLYRDILGNKWGASKVSIHYDPNKILGKKRTYKKFAKGTSS